MRSLLSVMSGLRAIATGCVLLGWVPGAALCADVAGPEKWEKDIQAFEAADRTNPPPKGAILFIGSSSIRLWKTLAQDFPGHAVINRGFGGSEIADSIHFADRIVFPYEPRMIVMFAGGNDIHRGKTAEQVAGDFRTFVAKVRSRLPGVRLAYISSSPTPARWDEVEKIRALNRLIEESCAKHEGLVFINIFPHLLGEDGLPRPEIFQEDRLHLNAKGYEIWTRLVTPCLGPATLGQVLSLNGSWVLEPADGEAREVKVPGFWERIPGLGNVHVATYRREFDVPASFAKQRIFLKFDAVGDAADVSVNGQHAGGHIGAALPFTVDITGLVRVPSTSNKLAVLVRDDSHFSVVRENQDRRNRKHWLPRGMGANNRKGLYQNVALHAVPPVAVTDARIATSVRKKELGLQWEIFNSRKETVSAQLTAEVVGLDGGVAFALPATDVELPGYVTTTVPLTSPFSGVQLWQPDHPTLYQLRTTLTDRKGTLLHRTQARFGFRETWFAGIHFYLNGIRCNLRGESPAYGEKTELFATRETATEMIRRYQAANCNVLRFHALPAPPHVLDVCDELGMMVIDESGIYASWQMLMPEHPEWMANCREHLTRWVRRDRHHPSVILWSAENEGLNVNLLTPAMLAEFKRVIDAADGSRPVIFDGDGTAYGISPASVKHYVRTIEDLQDRGGRSSGYARDLRDDIYWATAYQQDVPLGCGEFLFPYEPGLRAREREVIYAMGLHSRGYRLADWFDIRPYNPSYAGFLRPEGVKPEHQEAYEILVKSFAPIAVFDRDYDALGPFPKPPVLKAGQAARRTLIVYNDAFSDEQVEVRWSARLEGHTIAGEARALQIPLGGHARLEISFTPARSGELRLELTTSKANRQQFTDTRLFVVE